MKEKSNKQQVAVNIHSECRSREEMFPMDVYTTGSLYQKNNHLYLVYEEEDEGVMDYHTAMCGGKVTMSYIRA